MKEFKIRASSAGKLMTAPRSKTETLSETTKTYLKEWVVSEIYGYQKEIKSKYITKGVTKEDEGIDKAIEWLDLDFVLKNEQYFEDDNFCGTPDIITDDEVIDIKLSWDCFTFPIFEKEIPTKDYYFQLQVYMHLTGKKRSRLVYVLLNTPEEMHWEQQLKYDDKPKELRIKAFEVDYDPAVIEELKNKVIESRKYINENLNY